LLALVLGGCANLGSTPEVQVFTEQVEVTRVVEQTVIVEKIVEVIVTATPAPTEPSLEVAVAGDPASGELLDGKIKIWCLPQGKQEDLTSLTTSGTMLAEAQPARVVDGVVTQVIESVYCAFTYDFGVPAPQGTLLKVFDPSGTEFVSQEMLPVDSNPNMVYTVVRHPYVVNPPFWTIEYKTGVYGSGGEEIAAMQVNYKRGWTPFLCYGGVWPEPANLTCPAMGEAHPWDPWYGYDQPYDGLGDR
jgi:hypothetical protein